MWEIRKKHISVIRENGSTLIRRFLYFLMPRDNVNWVKEMLKFVSERYSTWSKLRPKESSYNALALLFTSAKFKRWKRELR